MRNPKEDLEEFVGRVQNQISSIQKDVEKALPVPLPESPVDETKLIALTVHNKLEALRLSVDQLRIRALRGLPGRQD